MNADTTDAELAGLQWTILGRTCSASRCTKTGLYVSRCPILGIVTQGRTLVEALDTLQDAIQMTVKYTSENVPPKP